MKKTLFVAIATLFITTTFAQQQERIIRFHSDIKIETDGRIEVAEHIKVYATGDEIKRGIWRKLPLYRENNKGKQVRVDYRFLSVQCNGADAKYHTEHKSGNLVVYIGEGLTVAVGFPRNMSPASVRYLTANEYENTALTATLVEMAVKGAMSIRCNAKKEYSLVNKMNTDRLRPEEQKIHATVFAETKTKTSKAFEQIEKLAESNPALKESLKLEELQTNLPEIYPEVEVNRTNYGTFSIAGYTLKSAMAKQWNLKDYFRKNRKYITMGGAALNMIFLLYILWCKKFDDVLKRINYQPEWYGGVDESVTDFTHITYSFSSANNNYCVLK